MSAVPGLEPCRIRSTSCAWYDIVALNDLDQFATRDSRFVDFSAISNACAVTGEILHIELVRIIDCPCKTFRTSCQIND